MIVTDGRPHANLATFTALAWTAAATALTAVAGFWPTYAVAGKPGLLAMLAAGLIVLGVGSASISVVGAVASKGGGKLALGFILSGMVKVLACAMLGLAAGLLLPVPAGALSLWLCIFYVAVLAAQIAWVVKILRQDGR